MWERKDWNQSIIFFSIAWKSTDLILCVSIWDLPNSAWLSGHHVVSSMPFSASSRGSFLSPSRSSFSLSLSYSLLHWIEYFSIYILSVRQCSNRVLFKCPSYRVASEVCWFLLFFRLDWVWLDQFLLHRRIIQMKIHSIGLRIGEVWLNGLMLHSKWSIFVFLCSVIVLFFVQ